MQLHVLDGDRAAALRVYYHCATILQGELDVAPDATTQEAYRRLLGLDAPANPRPLSGTLDVRLGDGYNPAFGDEFVVLTCSLGCNGEFEAVEFSPSEDDFELIYSANSVTVRWIGESPIVVPNEFILFLPMTVR
jgi:hypothetical protein